MKVNDLVAIDAHTHAEVSCRQPADAFWQPYEDAANKYFKAGKRPTIAETIAHPSWPWQDEAEAGFKPEVHDLILKQNAIRALKIGAE
jgi:hypothetical protein